MSCWFCKRALSQSFASSPPPSLRAGQYSLAALLALMTAAAVWLGIFLLSPALAVVIAVFAGSALARLIVVELLATASSGRHVPAHFASRYLASLAIVIVAAVAAAIAFAVGIFMSVMLGDTARPIPDFPLWPIGLGFVIGLVLAGWVLWATRMVTLTD